MRPVGLTDCRHSLIFMGAQPRVPPSHSMSHSVAAVRALALPSLAARSMMTCFLTVCCLFFVIHFCLAMASLQYSGTLAKYVPAADGQNNTHAVGSHAPPLPPPHALPRCGRRFSCAYLHPSHPFVLRQGAVGSNLRHVLPSVSVVPLATRLACDPLRPL